MRRFYPARFLGLLFLLFFLIPLQVFADGTMTIPSSIPSQKDFKISYSGMDDGECYIWRIKDASGKYLHSDYASVDCDDNENDYIAYKVPDTEGAIQVSALAAGTYTIEMYHKHINRLRRDSVDKIETKSFTVQESSISPSPSPAPIDCDHRTAECSKDKFPQCEKASVGAGNIANCGSSDYSCAMDDKTGTWTRYCTYAADVTPPPSDTSNVCAFDLADFKDTSKPLPQCAPGWKPYSPTGGAATCTCIPEGVAIPSPDPNSCPVCPKDYPVYRPLEDTCGKDSSSTSDSTFPQDRQSCSPDACHPGQGCDLGACTAVPTIKQVCNDTLHTVNPAVSCTGGYSCPKGSNLCYGGSLTDNPRTDDKVKCQSEETLPTPPPPSPPCATGLDDPTNKYCRSIATPLGELSTDPTGFINSLFTILLSLSGGVALLLIIFSGYQLMISQGNPEIIKAAKERLTSAFIGILFLIFSLVILQVIGVDILNLPGFGT